MECTPLNTRWNPSRRVSNRSRSTYPASRRTVRSSETPRSGASKRAIRATCPVANTRGPFALTAFRQSLSEQKRTSRIWSRRMNLVISLVGCVSNTTASTCGIVGICRRRVVPTRRACMATRSAAPSANGQCRFAQCLISMTRTPDGPTATISISSDCSWWFIEMARLVSSTHSPSPRSDASPALTAWNASISLRLAKGPQ